jgi:PAS domain S-box-containing protein
MAFRNRLFWWKPKGWLKQAKHRLYGYRPRFKERNFWAVQVLVLVLVVVHNIFEAGGFIGTLGPLYFVPLSLLLVPVMYAAVTFGFVGAVATALWATAITIPNFIFQHGGVERFWEIFQILIVIAMAFFMGRRVDRERGARRQAGAAVDALGASEIKYRGLFKSSPIAILVLSANGAILNANPAAGALFNKATEAMGGMAVADLVGKENEQKLLAPSQKDDWQEASFTLRPGDGSEVYLEPTHTSISGNQGNIATQVLLRDVTQERQRQAGLRAYAAHILRAQEEERQRIARELHDETIQTLVLLCRRLDAVGGGSKVLPSPLKRELQEARKITEGAVKELRDFAKALRPTALDDLGVVTSIRRLLTDCTERTGVQAKLKLVGKELRLSRDIELGMFRIAQEALWNMERHSKATKVTVTITFSQYEVRVGIKDNGLGFDVPLNLGTSGHLGLLGMHERAELLDGKLEIISSPGKGATATVSIPLPGKILYAPARVK